MKVLVAVKRVIDYNVRIQVRRDGSGIESTNVKMSMNPFDEIAVEEAVRLKEAGTATEVVAVTLGGEADQDVLRHALALGADRAVRLEGDEAPQPPLVAAALQALVAREAPALVLLGKQAIDDDASQTGPLLAARLGWPQGTFVSRLEMTADTATVTREVDGGLETLALRLPCVITTDLRLNAPRFASLPNLMKARRQPVETLSLADLGVTPPPGLKTLSVAEPPSRRAGRQVADVAELVHCLREEGLA